MLITKVLHYYFLSPFHKKNNIYILLLKYEHFISMRKLPLNIHLNVMSYYQSVNKNRLKFIQVLPYTYLLIYVEGIIVAFNMCQLLILPYFEINLEQCVLERLTTIILSTYILCLFKSFHMFIKYCYNLKYHLIWRFKR